MKANLDLTNSSTETTGSVAIPNAETRRNFKVQCTCAASITFALKAGATSTRTEDVGTSTGTSVLFTGDTGPWPVLELHWSGNSTNQTVYVDAILSRRELD